MLKAIRQLFKKSQVEVLPEYQQWREVIFSATAEQVGMPSSQADRVYGVVMDVGLANENGSPVDANQVISVTAFASGESSLRTSFGGGLIGLGGEEEISEQAQQIIRLAELLLDKTKPTPSQALPPSGKVYFYFLTTSGNRLYEGSLKEVFAEGHPFSELFARFSVIKNRADDLMRKYYEQ